MALLLCLIIHVVLFLLLRDALRAPSMPLPDRAIAVTLLDAAADAPQPLTLPPPMPEPAPLRSARAAALPPTRSTPRQSSRAAATVNAAKTTSDNAAPELPSAAQLLDSATRVAAEVAHDDAAPDRGFLAHRKANLPGRDQAIVAGIALRQQTSLKNIVQGATQALHGMFACGGTKHDTAPLDSEKLIASPIAAMMDQQYDIGPDNEECPPEK